MIVVDKEHFQALSASIATACTYHAQALGDEPRAMKYARQALDVNKRTLAITKAKELNIKSLTHQERKKVWGRQLTIK